MCSNFGQYFWLNGCHIKKRMEHSEGKEEQGPEIDRDEHVVLSILAQVVVKEGGS